MKKLTLSITVGLLTLTGHGAEIAGTVKTVKGQAHIERGSTRIDVAVGSSLHAQDKLISGPISSVGVTLRDSTMLTAGPNSIIELKKYTFDRNTNVGHMDTSVKKGSLAVVSGQLAKHNPEQVVFSTDTVTLGVRGTEFIIDVDDEIKAIK